MSSTTMLYVHEHITKVRSPLDDAVEKMFAQPAPVVPPVPALPFSVA